jgi:hypothetical protein
MLNTEPYVRVIALNFSKAFDTVRHVHLNSKLNKLNTPNGWFASFFNERSHNTIIEFHTSSSNSINASVLQGSALGRSTFIITASELTSAKRSTISFLLLK